MEMLLLLLLMEMMTVMVKVMVVVMIMAMVMLQQLLVVTVLPSFSGNTKISYTGWHRSRYLFFTVLEVGKSKVKVPA